MNNLISNGNCNWRFHLLYAQLLCRVSLDSNSVQQQIDLGIFANIYTYNILQSKAHIIY